MVAAGGQRPRRRKQAQRQHGSQSRRRSSSPELNRHPSHVQEDELNGETDCVEES
jgi:hypothetical protein